MSRTLHARRLGVNAARAALLAMALAGLAALAGAAGAPRAEAAFATAQCQGAPVLGRGASFARAAHDAWEHHFRNFFCSAGPNITYDPAGSGGGRTGMTLRGPSDPRFGGTDDALTAPQKASIEAGDPDNPNDDGVLHQVPAAVGAVAVLVNFPNNCDATLLDDANRVDPGAPDNLIRARFDKQTLERIFAGDGDHQNWVDVFPELDEDADCDKPIVRVVRWDHSGTTFAFKDYLSRINGEQGWTGPNYQGSDNRRWPNATLQARADCGGNTGPGTADGAAPEHITSGCASGAENLVAKLNQVDGGIGYADVASARSAFAVNPLGSTPPDKYWTRVQNGAGQWQEPTADDDGYQTTGDRGANCTTTAFVNVAASTLGDWSQTSGVNSPTGYGLCTLTYGMLFDDHAETYGTGAIEEQRARTVKDYWTSILSSGGQVQLTLNDYAPLPAGILSVARDGVAGIDWNKGAGGGGGGGGGGNPPGGNDNPPGGGTPPAAKPSNRFSVPRTAIASKTGNATVSVRLPGAGRLVLVGNAKQGRKTIRVGRVVLTANRAGTFKVTLKPSKAAKRILRNKGRLKTTLKLTFTPKGGTARSTAKTVVLKLAKPKRKSGRR